MTRFNYLLLRLVYRIFKKDPMSLKIKYYRSLGAKIGLNVRAFSPLLSAEPYLLEFGNNITVSTDVKFTTHDNSVSKVIANCTDTFGRIKIGDNCFIGQNSLILPGVEIADNIIIAAGSIVTKSFLTEGIIIGGNPAKVIGHLDKYSEKYQDIVFNTRGLSYEDKRKLILSNEKQLIKK